MFGMVVERVFIADMQKVSGDIERKVTAVGISNLLIDCPAMLESPYNVYYPRLLVTLLEFFELPQDQSVLPEDGMFPEIEDSPGYQVGYSQLACAKNPPKDPLEGTVASPVYGKSSGHDFRRHFSFFLYFYIFSLSKE